ncbi:MAG: TrkA family potassium uptake protein [Acidobacteriota bacterium]|nr:TrkA family potassium uptake protein [Acidobacteriota bacterium]
MKRTIAILGLSVFGYRTALGLAEMPEIDVIVFDRDQELIDRISPHVARAVIADIREAGVLEEEGAQGWWAAVLAMRKRFDTTVLLTHHLKQRLKVPRLVVQVDSRDEEEALRVLGADQTVFPERDTAKNLVATLARPGLTQFVDLGPDVDMGEHRVPASFVGQTLKDLHLRDTFGLHVVAIRHEAGPTGQGVAFRTEVPPDPDRELTATDRLFLIGSPKALRRFSERFAES